MPLPANDRLVLLRIKIERAKKHFRDLEAELGKTRGRTRDTLYAEQEPNSLQSLYRRDLPVYTLDVLAISGDLIHNLRSALDHLAYHLVMAETDGTPSRRAAFPIAKDRATYESDKAGKVEGVRPEAIEVIDGFRPYNGGSDVLWRIHELDNIDKHRYVFTVGGHAIYIADWWEGGEFLLKPRALKADSPTFASAHEEEVKDDVDLPIYESVFDPEVIKGDALLPTMKKFIDFTEALILKFKPFLG